VQYLGGKSRICKQIIQVMESEREETMTWVEPFVGSAKVISKVQGERVGADVNHQMIALFEAIRSGWEPPKEVPKDLYEEVKNNQSSYPDHLCAFISIGCAFGGKRWGGYASNKKNTNYALSAYRALMRLKPLLTGIKFHSCDYQELTIPPNSLIYCDPPYRNTAGYGFDFNHDQFYDWCREQVNAGHLVFVSEYDMPPDFQVAWSKSVSVSFSRTNKTLRKTEKLFRLHAEREFSLKMY
jgi:DNA adenine methylase